MIRSIYVTKNIRMFAILVRFGRVCVIFVPKRKQSRITKLFPFIESTFKCVQHVADYTISQSLSQNKYLHLKFETDTYIGDWKGAGLTFRLSRYISQKRTKFLRLFIFQKQTLPIIRFYLPKFMLWHSCNSIMKQSRQNM